MRIHIVFFIFEIFRLQQAEISSSNQKSQLKVQENLCQKLLFLHQLTHNMTADCSLNYHFSTWKFQAPWGEHEKNMLCTQFLSVSVLTFRTTYVINMFFPMFSQYSPMFSTCSELGIFMYWTGNSLDNLLLYCGLVDARIRIPKKIYLYLIATGFFFPVKNKLDLAKLQFKVQMDKA